MACGCEQEAVTAMATVIPKGTRLVAEVDLGGIGVAAGEEFEVDDCNCHVDFDSLLATGAVTRAKTTKAAETSKSPDVKPSAGGDASRPADTTKPEPVKPATGGADGR